MSAQKPNDKFEKATEQSVAEQPMQLPLAVTLPDDELFDSFYQGGNEQLIAHLIDVIENQQRSFSYTLIAGAKNSGKSHLLYASCVKAQELGLSNVLLPLEQLVQMKPQLLDGLEQYDVVCIDNIEVIAGNRQWENALFYLFNLLDGAGKTLIMASSDIPTKLNLTLPDLVSRLDWGVSFQTKALCDDDKVKALQMRAKLRGLTLSNEAGKFLISRLTRDIRSLIHALDRLDKASIAMQRKLTIPFIKSILSL